MDAQQFDRLARHLSRTRRRRGLLAGVLTAALGGGVRIGSAADHHDGKQRCRHIKGIVRTVTTKKCPRWYEGDEQKIVACALDFEVCLDLLEDCNKAAAKRAQRCMNAALKEWRLCERDHDCREGEICQGEQGDRCVKGCREDAHCPEGKICSQSRCVKGCRSADTCPHTKPFCLGGQCYSTECVDGDDCPETKPFCRDGVCRKKACEDDGDCRGRGRRCLDGVCRECLYDGDCRRPGLPRCLSSVCVQCRFPSDCGPDGVCTADGACF